MISGRRQTPIRCQIRTLPALNAADVRAFVGRGQGGAILESVAADASWGRYSIFAVDPVETLVVQGGGAGHDPFDALAVACRPWATMELAGELPFSGGWIGYFAYEAASSLEPTALRRTRSSFPAAIWRLYDTAIIEDRRTGAWYAVAADLPVAPSRRPRPSSSERLKALEQGLIVSAGLGPAPIDERPGVLGPARWSDSVEAYLDNVERALEYIRAGDIFQVNLSRCCYVDGVGDALALYQRLCRTNPSAFAAWILLEQGESLDSALVSSSPELFLSLRGREVITRPIKGSRPRGGDSDSDARMRAELAASPKDRAELNMIIDLERNDLGRVCEFGSVRVLSDGDVETHPTVFHRTATIAGRLREDCDAIDLLRATFPGGSITGAPKVRAMQIIEELEGRPRGAYCGAIGYIGLDGTMLLNLAIRTMCVRGGVVEIPVGSGIVADSVPQQEYEELQAKAAGMIAALRAPVAQRVAEDCSGDSSNALGRERYGLHTTVPHG